MTIGFLRHAEAEDPRGSDFERQLTAKGLDQAAKVGKFCQDNGIVPDLVIASPVVRTRDTARIVVESLDCDLVEERWLACGMEADTCLREVRAFAHKGFLLLVGHEPDFSHAIAHLIGLADPSALKIRKASLTLVDLAGFEAGSGQLQFSIPVRLM